MENFNAFNNVPLRLEKLSNKDQFEVVLPDDMENGCVVQMNRDGIIGEVLSEILKLDNTRKFLVSKTTCDSIRFILPKSIPLISIGIID